MKKRGTDFTGRNNCSWKALISKFPEYYFDEKSLRMAFEQPMGFHSNFIRATLSPAMPNISKKCLKHYKPKAASDVNSDFICFSVTKWLIRPLDIHWKWYFFLARHAWVKAAFMHFQQLRFQNLFVTSGKSAGRVKLRGGFCMLL